MARNAVEDRQDLPHGRIMEGVRQTRRTGATAPASAFSRARVALCLFDDGPDLLNVAAALFSLNLGTDDVVVLSKDPRTRCDLALLLRLRRALAAARGAESQDGVSPPAGCAADQPVETALDLIAATISPAIAQKVASALATGLHGLAVSISAEGDEARIWSILKEGRAKSVQFHDLAQPPGRSDAP